MASFFDKLGKVANTIQKAERVANGLKAIANDVASFNPSGGLEAISNVVGVARSVANVLNDGIIRTPIDASLPLRNPLELFASYNYIFTLSALRPDQVNFPDTTYKRGDLGTVVLRSGGGADVTTAYGKFDYYIDDVDIETICSFSPGTQSSNATKLTFTVFEPYSMGLFLQSLQLAAQRAGYPNYIECPYLLTIEFMGYDNNGNAVKAQGTTRNIPIKLTDARFNVTASGSQYECEAIPYNEIAFTDSTNKMAIDAEITGTTVQEMLQSGEQSLQSAINKYYKKQVDEGKLDVAPEILILFPANLASGSASETVPPVEGTDQATVSPGEGAEGAEESTIFNKLKIGRNSVTQNLVQAEDVNPIGNASMGFDALTGGEVPFPQEGDAFDEEANTFTRGNLRIDINERLFRFKQNSSITNAIQQVILMSNYARKVAQDRIVDEKGMITWFKIETQTYIIPDQLSYFKTGAPAKLVVYRVVPYKVHSMRFVPPGTKPQGYPALAQQVAKQYDYLYGGQNVDVLKFDINIQFAFFTNMTDSQLNADAINQNQQGAGGNATSPMTNADGEGDQGAGQAPARPTATETALDNNGGGGTDDDATRVAKMFHDNIINSPADLTMANMEILGDPYYIMDSGMGNYSAQTSQYDNVNTDGSMDYQNGEVDITVTFRTPIDYNAEGQMDFGSSVKAVEPFSGLYQVTFVNSKFSGGQFTQDLQLIRRRNQELEESAGEVKTYEQATPEEVSEGRREVDTGSGG
jgi:hypothetical protein